MKRRNLLLHLIVYPLLVIGIATHAEEVDQSFLLKIVQSWHKDAGGDLTGDGITDYQDLFYLSTLWRTDFEQPPLNVIRFAGSSPMNGEVGVAVTRETILRFDDALDENSITDNSVTAVFGGSNLPYRRHLSNDGKTLTLFYRDPLPPSARVRVMLNGENLRGRDGTPVDINGNGTPGGLAFIDFETLSLTVLELTAVCGRVFASELNPNPNGELSINTPLEGVKITVDGREDELFTFTDEFGNFRLEPAPAGRFFVHVDGRSARLNVPPGAYYPFVGKTWESIPGEEVNVGNVYLPLVQEGTLQPVSPTEPTTITFVDQVVNEFPEFRGVSITVPPDSLFADSGERGGSVGIAPVPPDRLPGELPPGLEFPVVITVQTDGPANFDVPVPACFPNLPDPVTGAPLPPGTKNGLFSFNHDTGKWEYQGLMTVSEDGTAICTDPGVGITAPGWHGSGPPPTGPPPPPCPNPPCDCTPNPNEYNKCLRRCSDDALRCIGYCTAAAAAGIAACWLAGPGFPICAGGVLAAQAICEAACIHNGVVCQNRCNEDFNCGPPAKVSHQDLLYSVIQQVEEDDPIVAQIIAIVDELGKILSPYVMADASIPQEVQDQVDALIAQMVEISNGDPEGYMNDYLLQLELQAAPNEQGIGMSPGNAPSYPVMYMAEIHRPDGVLRLRGETEGFGQYTLFMPRDGELLYVSFYDPRTNSYGITYPRVQPNLRYQIEPFYLMPLDDTFPDTDNDGLADVVEFVYGTDPGDPDSDGDGIPDGAEVDQGTNPLDGRPGKTGIVATADTPGTAVDIDAFNDQAVLADTREGITVFNVFNGMNPTIIAQVNTPGEALAVSVAENLIAVADGSQGVAVIDMTDPPNARIIHQLKFTGRAQAVVTGGGVAYVGFSSGQLVSIHLQSGTILERLTFTGPVEDVALAGDYLYVLTFGRLHAVSLFDAQLTVTGSVASQGSRGAGGRRMRLFVGGGFAYATHTSGYNTFSLANPANPQLITNGQTPQFGWKHIVANGSGLGVAAVSPNSTNDGPHHVYLYDVSDPTETNVFLTQFETPGLAAAVSIYNGLAYVADSERGMQVINYLQYDALKVAPSIEIFTNFAEGRAEEGKPVIVTANVTDDVQVRNVEFYVDGVHMATDGNFPFEYRFIAPLISQQPSFTLRARASDTGGNFTWTDEIVIVLEPDATPPRVVRSTPRTGSVLGEIFSMSAYFSEPIDESSLTEQNFLVFHAGADGNVGTDDDVPISGGSVSYQEDIVTAFLNFERSLEPGLYLVAIAPPLADLAGNQIQQEYTWSFRIYSDQDTDGDGIPDDLEVLIGTDPNDNDSNNDGIFDGFDDFDRDGLINIGELIMGTDMTLPDTDGDGILDGDEDADFDFLSDGQEILAGTDPFNSDTDGDGVGDVDELALGTDPLDPLSKPSTLTKSAPVSYLNALLGEFARERYVSSQPVSYLNALLGDSAQVRFVSSQPASYLNALLDRRNEEWFTASEPVSYLNALLGEGLQQSPASPVVSYQNGE